MILIKKNIGEMLVDKDKKDTQHIIIIKYQMQEKINMKICKYIKFKEIQI